MNVQPCNAEVDRILERYAREGSPGCALAVIQDGAIVYMQGYGLANLEHAVPNLPSTVFNIGSMAKQFTAFAVALLEDEGRLSFDDELRVHLPEMDGFGQKITLRHLIHHTSGIRCSFPDLLALSGWREGDLTTTNDVFRLLRAQRETDFPPGSEFSYSNSNYVLLALVCERVSGQSFATFCQERIFGPLAMAHSTVNDSPYKTIPGRADGYFEDGEGRWARAPLADAVVGPTNIYTTVEDLALWGENLTTGKVGGPAVIEQMHQPGRLNDGTLLNYAFGLELNHHRGWQVVEHGGGQGGYVSWMARFPEPRLSVVVLFNHFLWGSRDDALRVADLFLEERPAKTAVDGEPAAPMRASPVELDAEKLQPNVGLYYNARRAALREITLSGGRLQYQGLDLVPVGENRFYIAEEPDVLVEFEPGRDGPPMGVKTTTHMGSYEYRRVERIAVGPEDLEQYAGRYYSPELNAFWTIVLAGDRLAVRRQKYVDTHLAPLFVDAFSDDWEPIVGFPWTYTALFERDAQGMIAGLRVSGSRARNLWFARQDV